MASNNLIGYVGGLAVAAGVGAAVVVAGQGVANADTDAPDTTNASESADHATNGTKQADTKTAGDHTGPVSKVGSDVSDAAPGRQTVTVEGLASPTSPTPPRAQRPSAEEVEATQVEKPRSLHDRTKPKSAASTVTEQDAASTDTTGSGAMPSAPEQVTPAANTAQTQDVSAQTPDPASETDVSAPAQAVAAASDATEDGSPVTAGITAVEEVPWSPNPWRPMPPEPAPNDMPGVIWTVEQAIVNLFAGLPGFEPFPREAFEFGYRISQMVPWVNVVIPLSNILADLPAAITYDKNATQRIVNNFVIIWQPLAIAYYGYNELADAINLEQQALDFQHFFFATIWSILDPFQLLHNAGASGLPLSTTTPPPYPPATEPAPETVIPVATAASASPLPDPIPFLPVGALAMDVPATVRAAERYSAG